jgi:hypothetical protein
VLRIHVVVVGIEKIVGDEDLVPCSDKVQVNIISDSEIAIHAQETRQRTIDGVMESYAIKSVLSLITKEIFILGFSDYGRVKEAQLLSWRATTTAVT